jgi:hypothetical protein
MTTKKEREQKEVERLIEFFRKFPDEHLIWLINQRISKVSKSPNSKAFNFVLKERGIDKKAL